MSDKYVLRFIFLLFINDGGGGGVFILCMIYCKLI